MFFPFLPIASPIVWLAGLIALALLLSPFLAFFTAARLRRLERRVAALERRLAVPVGPAPREQTEAAIEMRSPEPPPAPAPAPDIASVEQRFAERGLVWVGGLALAAGGLFGVLWAVEQGFVGIRLRLAAIGLLGLVAVVGGWFASARSGAGKAGAPAAPAALAAGGLVTLYADIFAAHARYAQLAADPAFALLALTSLLGLACGWRFGWPHALLAALGGFAVPAVVDAGVAEPWVTFGYLAVLATALSLIALLRSWWWLLLFVVLPASAFWISLALFADWLSVLFESDGIRRADAAALLALALGAANAPLPALLAAANLVPPPRPPMRLALAASYALAGLAAIAAAVATGFTPGLVAVLILLALAGAAASLLYEPMRAPAFLGALLALAVVGLWEIDLSALQDPLFEPGVGLAPLFPHPRGIRGLLLAALATGSGFAALGFLAARRRPPGGLWASLSAAVPLAALALLRLRLEAVGIPLPWPHLALGLALLAAAAARVTARDDRLEAATAAYVVGALAALALGAAFLFAATWLRLALALIALLAAILRRRFAVPGLAGGAAALGLAAALLVIRAAYEDLSPEMEEVLLGALLPGLCCGAASSLLRRGSPVPMLLLATARDIALLAAFTLLLLVVNGYGPALIDHPPSERGLALAVWIAVATAFATLGNAGILPPSVRHLWAIFAFASLPTALELLLDMANPALGGWDVGLLPLLDGLAPAYLAPALLLARLARRAAKLAPVTGAAAGTAALVFLLTWSALEIRHLLRGAVLTAAAGPLEVLLISLSWIAIAAALFVYGRLREDAATRRAGLLVASVTALKVFLVDLERTEGLYRALSFAGLGIALVAIGWLYRRSQPAGTASPRGLRDYLRRISGS